MEKKIKVLVYGNSIFSLDMLWGFREAGCDAGGVITYREPAQFRQILLEEKIDLLFTLGPPLELNRDILYFLGKERPADLKHIHWDTDGISSMGFPSRWGEGIEMDAIYASRPDMVLTMCPEMYDVIIGKGFACGMMQYGYSPVSHFPMPEYYDEEHKYINLIGHSYAQFYSGNPDHYRYESLKILVKPLIENGYTVNVYGDKGYLPFMRESLGIEIPQKYYRGLMRYESTCAAYNSSFINLVTQNHQDTLTKRTFEILGSGGFALSADNGAIRKLFVPGRDLEVSASGEQTLALIKYYENHAEEWRKIRKNALLSVQKHTYKERAAYVLEQYHKL